MNEPKLDHKLKKRSALIMIINDTENPKAHLELRKLVANLQNEFSELTYSQLKHFTLYLYRETKEVAFAACIAKVNIQTVYIWEEDSGQERVKVFYGAGTLLGQEYPFVIY